MKKPILIVILVACYLLLAAAVDAAYVLPYPSYMPGNKLYNVSRLIDEIKKYWHFGNLSRITYHISLSDKYLVEAKTLFEYKQYVLALDALRRSDDHFVQINRYLSAAGKEGKDVTPWRQKISAAALAHQGILNNLLKVLPKTFLWEPEKANPIMLNIHDALQLSLSIKQSSR